MKAKMTAKQVRQMFPECLSAGYGDLQYLLRGQEPIAYTCGVYGWNFDVYQVHGVTICTGYRNMPGRTANNIREFESKASDIWNDFDTPYDKRAQKVARLLKRFCKQA